LHRIRGKELVLWVAERISRVAPQLDLWFAVDDASLAACLKPAGYRTVMTSVGHASGTDRLAEANRTVRADRVINVQADEPLVSAGQVRMLAELIQGPADMATLACRFTKGEDFCNPNQVKVVCDANGRALYFSRAPVPYARDSEGRVDDAWVGAHPCYKHLGLYAYKAALLEEFVRMAPGRLEQMEKLEQLRVLENGREIVVGLSDDQTIGVDTPEDAARFEAFLGA
jgi:3-deoxy-manno-octulosonate cytidylyltransferase (CMP-KDO synthetase)